MPFSRSSLIAASMSPPVSSSARLQSIMPACVASRSAFTSLAAGVYVTSLTRLFLTARLVVARGGHRGRLGLVRGLRRLWGCRCLRRRRRLRRRRGLRGGLALGRRLTVRRGLGLRLEVGHLHVL